MPGGLQRARGFGLRPWRLGWWALLGRQRPPDGSVEGHFELQVKGSSTFHVWHLLLLVLMSLTTL